MKKVLIISDISVLTKNAMNVNVPIISSFGYSTFILPTYLLTKNTSFSNIYSKDLYQECIKMLDEIKDVFFDYIYIGYIPNIKLIKALINFFERRTYKILFDPIFADNFKFYTNFNVNTISYIKEIISHSNIITPNLTEALFLTNYPIKNKYYFDDYAKILDRLQKLNVKNPVITSAVINDEIGVFYKADGSYKFYGTKILKINTFGTGDLFSSLLLGYMLKTNDINTSIKKAVSLTYDALKNTEHHKDGIMYSSIIKKI